MRFRITFLLFWWLCFLGTLQARQLTLKGKVEQPLEASLSFIFEVDELTGDEHIYRVTLNDQNTFAVRIDIQDAEWIKVKHGNEYFILYAHPQAGEIQFRFQGGAMRKTIVFNGEDSSGNNFLANFRRMGAGRPYRIHKYARQGLTAVFDTMVVYKAKAYGQEDFFRTLREDWNYHKRYLHNHPNLNRELMWYLDKELDWVYESDKFAYFIFNKDRLSNLDVRKGWVRYGLLRHADITDDASVKYEPYQNMLKAFMHYLAVETPGPKGKQDLTYYQYVQGNLSGKSRFYMLAKIMLENYRQLGNPGLAQRKFKAFKRNNPYPAYTQSLQSIFGDNLEFVPKFEVPDFMAIDPSGREVHLTDYRGQVVYLSFWASWCGPCLKGFRETAQIRRQLDDQGVAFLNINFDEDPDIWRRAIERLNIPGTHLYPVDMDEFQQKMPVSALPYYIVVTKDGRRTFLSGENLNDSVEEFQGLLR